MDYITRHTGINLRREINREQEIVLGQRPGYVVKADSRHIDALHFEDLLQRSRKLLAEDLPGALYLASEAWVDPPALTRALAAAAACGSEDVAQHCADRLRAAPVLRGVGLEVAAEALGEDRQGEDHVVDQGMIAKKRDEVSGERTETANTNSNRHGAIIP